MTKMPQMSPYEEVLKDYCFALDTRLNTVSEIIISLIDVLKGGGTMIRISMLDDLRNILVEAHNEFERTKISGKSY